MFLDELKDKQDRRIAIVEKHVKKNKGLFGGLFSSKPKEEKPKKEKIKKNKKMAEEVSEDE